MVRSPLRGCPLDADGWHEPQRHCVSPRQFCDGSGAGVEMRDTEGADLHRPDAIGDFFKAEIVTLEGAPEEEDFVVPGDTAIRPHPPQLEMTRVYEARQPGRQRPRGWLIVGGRRRLPQRLMGPLVVVLPTELRKAPLLRGTSGRWRAGRLSLQHRVELLMGTVLLWVPGQNTLRLNPQLQPPDRQARQAPEASAGKGRPVVASHPSR